MAAAPEAEEAVARVLLAGDGTRRAGLLFNDVRAERDGLRAALADARDHVGFLQGWSNELAGNVPERYGASEGTVQGCISEWLRDVLADLDRFRTALQAVRDTTMPGAAARKVVGEALAAEASGEVDPQSRDDEPPVAP